MPFTLRELLEGPETSDFEQRIILACVLGVSRFSDNYRKAICFPEIFAPVTSLIEKLSGLLHLSGELMYPCQNLPLSSKTTIVDSAAKREPLGSKGLVPLAHSSEVRPSKKGRRLMRFAIGRNVR